MSQNLTVPSAAPEASLLPSDENLTQQTGARCGWLARSCPVATSHNLTVRSPLAEAKVLPSGENATDVTSPLCPCSVTRSLPLAASQSLAPVRQSLAPVASVLPSGEKATDQAPLTWNRIRGGSEPRSHTLTGVSPQSTVARVFPSGENAREHMLGECASKLRCPFLALMSQRITLPLFVPPARVRPSGEKAKETTPSPSPGVWGSVGCSRPVATSHNFNVLSQCDQLDAARVLPSGENARSRIPP